MYEREFDSELARLLDQIIVQNQIDELLAGLIGFTQRWGETDDDTKYRDTLDYLDSLVPVHSLAAFLLMARLFPQARGLSSSFVCDSIHVWLYRNHSPRLSAALEGLLAQESDEAMRAVLQGWIHGPR